jgi:transketolase
MRTEDRGRGNYAAASGRAPGACVLADAPDGKLDVLLPASGSELTLCREAQRRTFAIRPRPVACS